MPRYKIKKGNQTYFFDWDGDEKPTKEDADRIVQKLQEEEKLKSPVKHFANLGYQGVKNTLQEIKEGPVGDAWSWLFSPPDAIADLNERGQDLIKESAGPTPGIKSGDERLDTFMREGQREAASKGLDFLTPTRFDIGTLGLGFAAKPVLKGAAKVLPEIEEGVKFLSGIGHELSGEAGVLKVGGRAKGTNPRTLGTNPRAIKEAEKNLDTIIDLAADGQTRSSIAEKLGLKIDTINAIYKKHKLDVLPTEEEILAGPVKAKDQDIVDAVEAIAGGKEPPKLEGTSGSGGSNLPPQKGQKGIPEDETPKQSGAREPFRLRDLTDLLGPFQRSMQSLGEMSFPLRQGRVALASHPSHIPSVVKNMFKAAKDPQFSHEIIDEISKRPFANIQEFADTGAEFEPVTRNLYKEAKLGLSDPKDVFPSNLAHQIPGIAQLSKRSEAAYGAGADTLRANLFDQVLEKHGFDPFNLPDSDTIEQLGNYVNTVTGYGRGGQAFEQATPLLQYGLYSPRYQKSIFDMLNPVNYTGMTNRFGSIGAKEMAKDVGKFGAGAVGGLEGIDALVEPEENNFGLNPLDTDFLKFKMGNTRLDPLGGFAPMLRLGARTTHDLSQRAFEDSYEDLVEPVAGDLATKNYDLADEYERFGRSKLAPGLASLIGDETLGEGKNIVGESVENQPFSFPFVGKDKQFETPYLGYALNQTTPLFYQDMASIEDPETKAVAAPLGFFGVGTQTYERKGKEKKAKNPYAEVDRLYKKLYGR